MGPKNQVLFNATDLGTGTLSAAPADPPASDLPSFMPGADLGSSMGSGDDGGAGDDDGDDASDDDDPAGAAGGAGDDDDDDGQPPARPRKAEPKFLTINGRKFDASKLDADELQGLIDLNIEHRAAVLAAEKYGKGEEAKGEEDDFLANLGVKPKKPAARAKDADAEGDGMPDAKPKSPDRQKLIESFVSDIDEDNTAALLDHIESAVEERLASILKPLADAGLGKLLKAAPELMQAAGAYREQQRAEKPVRFAKEFAELWSVGNGGRKLDPKIVEELGNRLADAADIPDVKRALGDLFDKKNAEARQKALTHMLADIRKNGIPARRMAPGRDAGRGGRENERPAPRNTTQGPTAKGFRAWLNA